MLLLPPTLTREWVKTHPQVLFLFGTTVGLHHNHSEGKDVQSLHNVFWVPVKVKPCMDESAFFADVFVECYKDYLELAVEEFEKKHHGRWRDVVPDPGLGRSDWSGPLDRRSPMCFAALQGFVLLVSTAWKIDYNLKA